MADVYSVSAAFLSFPSARGSSRNNCSDSTGGSVRHSVGKYSNIPSVFSSATTTALSSSSQSPSMPSVNSSSAGGNNAKRPRRSTFQRTLDMEHKDVLNRIKQKKGDVENMRASLQMINTSIDEFEQRGLSTLNDDEMDALLSLRDRRSDIEVGIDQAIEQSNEVNYLVATGDILFKYYNVVEHGTHSSVTNPVASIRTSSDTQRQHRSCNSSIGGSINKRGGGGGRLSGGNNILKYFGSKRESDAGIDSTDASPQDTQTLPNTASGSTSSTPTQQQQQQKLTPNAVNKCANSNGLRDMLYDKDLDDDDYAHEDRASLLEKYMSFIDGNYLKHPQREGDSTNVGSKCPHCHGTNRVTMIHDGCIYCNDCFTQEYILIDHEKPSYKDPPKEVIYYAYKRINHFNEWLNQIQGKETTEIPNEVYDRILLEIKKEKISNMAMLKKEKVKSILKKLHINKYYEHVPHIIYRLNGLPVPHMPPQLEERLRHMFCQIQVPFLKHAPPERKNFLSYAYVLHKFMQLLEKDEYLPSFPLLKSREKLHNQDVVWQKICEELEWEFYKSI